MRKQLVVILAGAIALTSGCTALKVVAKGRPEVLTDQSIVKYVAAYRAIREISPDAAANMLKPGGDDLGTDDGSHQAILQALASAGYPDPVDFTRVNLAVGLAYSQVKGDAAAEKLAEFQASGLAKLDAALESPLLPEDAKAPMREQRAKLVAGMHTSKAWADRVLGWTRWLSDAKSVAVVKRHEDELEAAYSGQ